MDKDSVFNDMQLIKRELFAMRNGVVADFLRKGGCPFKIIFGVNLPQLVEIARRWGVNKELAIRLWDNSTTRESMLIAPMLMPHEDFSLEEAMEWVRGVPSVEIADVLCHRLLRHLPFALSLASSLVESDDAMIHYTGLRLFCNIAAKFPDKAREVGEAELAASNPATKSIASLLLSYSE